MAEWVDIYSMLTAEVVAVGLTCRLQKVTNEVGNVRRTSLSGDLVHEHREFELDMVTSGVHGEMK